MFSKKSQHYSIWITILTNLPNVLCFPIYQINNVFRSIATLFYNSLYTLFYHFYLKKTFNLGLAEHFSDNALVILGSSGHRHRPWYKTPLNPSVLAPKVWCAGGQSLRASPCPRNVHVASLLAPCQNFRVRLYYYRNTKQIIMEMEIRNNFWAQR